MHAPVVIANRDAMILPPAERQQSIRPSAEGDSQVFAQSTTKNASEPFFAGQVCSNKRPLTTRHQGICTTSTSSKAELHSRVSAGCLQSVQ